MQFCPTYQAWKKWKLRSKGYEKDLPFLNHLKNNPSFLCQNFQEISEAKKIKATYVFVHK